MIIVLADDFSGAAELAGMGANAGLGSTVVLASDDQLRIHDSAQLVAIDANTRIKSREEAARRTASLGAQLAELRPALVFKKTDSVLRGHVAVECAALARSLGKTKIALLPANPSRGRCILQGLYLIDGTPLEKTLFKNDPDFPAGSSSVADLLALDTSTLNGLGWHIPNASSPEQVTAYARYTDESILHAGAADYFAALLQHHGFAAQRVPTPGATSARSLWICGSHAAWQSRWSQADPSASFEIAVLPSYPKSLPAVLAIGEEDTLDPKDCLTNLIDTSRQVIEDLRPERLYIEGGATAHRLCRDMGWASFAVLPTPEPGVGILRGKAPDAPTLYIKPGSYPWPRWALPPDENL